MLILEVKGKINAEQRSAQKTSLRREAAKNLKRKEAENTMVKKEKSENDRQNDLLVVAVRKYLYLCDAGIPELAEAMGMCPATAYSRIRSPGNFTLDELRALRRKLRIPKEELEGLF